MGFPSIILPSFSEYFFSYQAQSRQVDVSELNKNIEDIYSRVAKLEFSLESVVTKVMEAFVPQLVEAIGVRYSTLNGGVNAATNNPRKRVYEAMRDERQQKRANNSTLSASNASELALVEPWNLEDNPLEPAQEQTIMSWTKLTAPAKCSRTKQLERYINWKSTEADTMRSKVVHLQLSINDHANKLERLQV
ncbi:hypothetical protein P3T76_010599 [Phytophthora citrophthora]|uniref:Uncharacterized protein n=1 Tax=Phytophthora citrophthora TaxID=4793 RepID=A0AAD9GBN6_9STRA|nr:hypothetical protein P3T76_010599 [Phytophthora citrophthora]